MTNKRYVQFEFPYDDFAVKDNQTNEELWNPKVVDRLNEQEETIQQYKHLVKIATSLIEWNTIPQVRREWEKHLSKVGDVE